MCENYDKIIVYQYGKVGSNTICNTLAKHYNTITGGYTDICNIYPEHIITTHNAGVFIDILEKYKSKKILIITITRNCITRALSEFFEIAGSITWINKQDDFHNLPKQDLLSMCQDHIRFLLSESSSKYIENVFDLIRTYTDIDIFDEINTEKKYFIKHVSKKYDDNDEISTKLSLLVYRFEDIHILSNILKDTLGIKCEIINGNESKNKWYIEEYNYCKQNLVLDNEIFENYYKTRHHQFIYKNEDDAINKFKHKTTIN